MAINNCINSRRRRAERPPCSETPAHLCGLVMLRRWRSQHTSLPRSSAKTAASRWTDPRRSLGWVTTVTKPVDWMSPGYDGRRVVLHCRVLTLKTTLPSRSPIVRTHQKITAERPSASHLTGTPPDHQGHHKRNI